MTTNRFAGYLGDLFQGAETKAGDLKVLYIEGSKDGDPIFIELEDAETGQCLAVIRLAGTRDWILDYAPEDTDEDGWSPSGYTRPLTLRDNDDPTEVAQATLQALRKRRELNRD